MPEIVHIAVDLGASSGRVLCGAVVDGVLTFEEVHRFPTVRLALPDGLHWDLGTSFAGILEGLRRATAGSGAGAESGGAGFGGSGRSSVVASIGIDTWGCDYGLIDGAGALLGLPFHHRDRRTATAVVRVHERVSPEQLYARTGAQHLAFNTVFQLADDLAAGRLATASAMLMIPDLLTYWLTGVISGEETSASTTALLDATTRRWADDLVDAIGIPRHVLPELVAPGATVGALRPDLAADEGLVAARVVRVGSHDTASAVVAVPAIGDEWGYISSGTWSLVGVETDRPIVTARGRDANFSNECGVDGRVRYLRNVMGLWLLQESIRTWRANGVAIDLAELLDAAEAVHGGPVIDPDDPELIAPGDLPARLARLCERAGQRPPSTPAETTRCILDSLAAAHARTFTMVEELTGRAVRTIHLVGGGAQNALLCQLTADACGRTVVAGPVEATAIGNLLVQARAIGSVSGSLDALRAIVRASTSPRRFEPRARAERR